MEGGLFVLKVLFNCFRNCFPNCCAHRSNTQAGPGSGSGEPSSTPPAEQMGETDQLGVCCLRPAQECPRHARTPQTGLSFDLLNFCGGVDLRVDRNSEKTYRMSTFGGLG